MESTIKNGIFKIWIVPFLLLLISINTLGKDPSKLQLWSDIIVGHSISNKFYAEADYRYRTQISDGTDKWNTNGLVLKLEYTSFKLLDVSFDVVSGITNQTAEIQSYEFSQRLGFKGYLFRNGNNLLKPKELENGISKRIEISNLIRFEHRYFNYSDSTISHSNWRIRNRTQVKYALNKDNFYENRLVKLIGDVEFYLPMGEEARERYVSKSRYRVGFDYRHTYRWRFYLYYIFENANDNVANSFRIDNHMVNIRLKHLF